MFIGNELFELLSSLYGSALFYLDNSQPNQANRR